MWHVAFIFCSQVVQNNESEAIQGGPGKLSSLSQPSLCNKSRGEVQKPQTASEEQRTCVSLFDVQTGSENTSDRTKQKTVFLLFGVFFFF